MLRSRAITIIGLSLIAVSAAAVLNSVRNSGDDVAAGGNVLPSTPQASELDRRQVSPLRAKAMKSFKKALSALHSSSASGVRRAGTHSATKNPLMRINHGRLSVTARNVPLNELLADISEKSGIAMSYQGLDEQTISLAFQRLPLDEGLRKILEHHDIFFLYGAGESAHTPTALWVYPRGKGREMVPVPPESWASTRELEQDLSINPDTGARMRAVETVIERKGDQATDTVLYALNDSNEQVRYSALSGAMSIGLALPDGTLESLAQYDPSHFIRSLALKAISEKPRADKLQVRSMAQAALADPHPDVRAQARDVIATLRYADQPQSLSQVTSNLRELLRQAP